MFQEEIPSKTTSDILERLDADKSLDLITVLKTINMKDVIHMAAKSYDEILPTTIIVKSWQKLWPKIEKNCCERHWTNTH